jgi:anti-sigma B factor antagonist
VKAPEHFRIDVRQEPDRAVLCLYGELDLASAPALEGELNDLDLSKAGTVVLDLRGLEFIDSSGLRMILASQQRTQEKGGAFAITKGSPQVQRLLAITRADEHLHVLASPGESA